MAGKSINSFGAKNWSPGSPSTRYNVSGKNREFYTFENAPGIGAYATGGTIIDGGDGYIYHIFTGTGTFTVNRPPAAINSVDYLIVAGGGGRANGVSGAGGGGGGGLRYGNTGITPGSYSIVVGAGGPSATPGPTNRNGSPSSAFGITATGGGGGAYDPITSSSTGQPGGSGGGGAPPAGSGGSAVPVIPYQGYDGTSASGPLGGNGGGAGGVAEPAGGGAGPGRILSQFPVPIVKSGVPDSTFGPLVGSLGYAAGGAGFPTPAPLTRTSPTGSGFGGTFTGYVGGSGIVCVRYRKVSAYTRATGGTVEPSTHPEHPGVWRHIFTSPGTFQVTDPSLQWIEYFAVGGGGGGGGSAGPPATFGGGGGGGGFVSSIHNSSTTPLIIPEAYPWNPGYSVRAGEQMPVGLTTYPITIGAGGTSGTAGSNTTIGNPGASQIIAYGGGAGGSAPGNGGNGGSGGGGAKPAPSVSANPGGTATPTPLIQGNNGGTSSSVDWPAVAAAAGGGGAGGAAAAPGPAPTVAIGGIGWYSVLSPSSYGTPGPVVGYRYFAGGGGGYLPPLGAPGVVGGAGGGGNGRGPTVGVGNSGTVNTGGGGGGGNNNIGGTGGPGIVIIQYPE